jgi:hypothetical protein
VLESTSRRTVLALACMLVALFACLTGGLMHASTAPPAPAPVEVVDLTSDTTAEHVLGTARGAA